MRGELKSTRPWDAIDLGEINVEALPAQDAIARIKAAVNSRQQNFHRAVLQSLDRAVQKHNLNAGDVDRRLAFLNQGQRSPVLSARVREKQYARSALRDAEGEIHAHILTSLRRARQGRVSGRVRVAIEVADDDFWIVDPIAEGHHRSDYQQHSHCTHLRDFHRSFPVHQRIELVDPLPACGGFWRG